VPRYEYLCSACRKKFSGILTLAGHEKGQVKCPKCGSTKIEQGPHFARRRLRKAELHECRAAGNPRSFGIFHVRSLQVHPRCDCDSA
jgi:putative FmdB family regulatory protein